MKKRFKDYLPGIVPVLFMLFAGCACIMSTPRPAQRPPVIMHTRQQIEDIRLLRQQREATLEIIKQMIREYNRKQDSIERQRLIRSWIQLG